MTILQRIIKDKARELEQEKIKTPVKQLEKSQYLDRPVFSLKNKLLLSPVPAVIAEFKRKSPSKGIINDNVSPERVAKGYFKAGATAISVLTNNNYFHGKNEDIQKIREMNIEIPILRKEFIIDTYQVVEAKSIGADLILLIAAALTRQETLKLSRFAKSIGLEVLLEIHREEELGHINEFVDIVGVNNRDLKTFNIDINISIDLSRQIPDDFVKISESGISKIETVNVLFSNGFKAFLIGGYFMEHEDPGKACRDFIEKIDNDPLKK